MDSYKEERSIYYQAFTRDGFCCVFCNRDILESFDTFAASHLDHLKPKSNGGPDDDVWNRVTSCSVSNSIKGSFDPLPGEMITSENFKKAISVAREHIMGKRTGKKPCSYYRDYAYWLKESGRNSQ